MEEFRAIVAAEQRVGIDEVTRAYLESLETLELGGTQVTDAGLKSLRETRPSLTIFS